MITLKTREFYFKVFRVNKVVNTYKVQNLNFHLHTNLNYKSAKKMLVNSNLLKPPEVVKDMQILEKMKFNKTICLPFIRINNKAISKIMPCLKKYLLKVLCLKPVVREEHSSVILLNPNLVTKWEDIEGDDRKVLTEFNASALETKTVTLTYDNYALEDVFRAVLPKDKEGMASFTIMGHIAHVNLREHLLPYKKLIGEVLLDKIPGCKTVVNKIDIIDNTYRNFQMEVLSGESNFMVKLKENKCTFEFDFSKVYWNSRLSTEHERIVNMIESKDVLFDVFAGVGPFSVPAAKKGAQVFGNDLNPESFKWLKYNIERNKLKSNISVYNVDGREFINTVLKSNLFKFLGKKIYIVMNLPALAVDFLDAFIGLYERNELQEMSEWPIVYVYCFTKGEDYQKLAKDLIVEKMGDIVHDKILEIFKVRTVSSMKEMMRIAFRLDADILGSCSKRKVGDNYDDFNFKKVRYRENKESEGQCDESN